MGADRFGAKPVHFPLLPFEKNLILQLGWTEEEYRWFKDEVEKKGIVRPAGYELIPDIQNIPVGALFFLAVGVALTAVSALMAPKPDQLLQEMQKQQQKQGKVTLGDRSGASRFNSTYGFDSNVELANWGEPIPIAFGKYTGTSGGLLISPKLVWSRLFSYGNYQAVKALYSCGEWGMANPNLAGIYLGNVPLDPAYDHLFAFYYKATEGENRLQGTDLLYGTRGTPESGDPDPDPDVFNCPTTDAEKDDGFCYGYTPSDATEFGVYNSLPNGHGLRSMWRVISIPQEGLSGDGMARLKYERQKITGGTLNANAMEGVGRDYVRGIGIYEVDGRTYSSVTQAEVGVGSVIKILISGGEIPDLYENDKYGVSTKDLNNTLENERSNADDLLQLGETFQIGRTSWLVIGRTLNTWKVGLAQEITLRCVDQFGWRWVTAIPRRLIEDFSQVTDGVNLNSDNFVDLTSTAISRQALGIVKNVREAEVIEVGIRSQVWNQANGMMNWQEVPEPEKLWEWDQDNTSVSGGQMSTYMLRTSVFTVKVRPQGFTETGEEYPFVEIPEQFCVRGRQPVAKYNFLRFYFPERGKYEFRFEPMPGEVIVNAFQPEELFWSLDANSTNILRKQYPTPYGTFEIKTNGLEIARVELEDNPETGYVDPSPEYSVIGDAPTAAALERYETAPYFDSHGKAHGWRGELLGFPQNYQNQTRSAEFYALSLAYPAERQIRFRITASSLNVLQICTPEGYTPQLGTAWVWGPPIIEIVDVKNDPVQIPNPDFDPDLFPPDPNVPEFIVESIPWEIGEQLKHDIAISRLPSNDNKWLHRAYTEGARTVSAVFSVSSIGELTVVRGTQDRSRNWIPLSQCASVTKYPGSWSTSADNKAEHEITYVNEIQINEPIVPNYKDMTMAGLSLKASHMFKSLPQVRFWIAGGVFVYRHLDGTTGRSNLFSDFVYWLLTDKQAGAGDKVSPDLMDTDSFARTAKFLEQNKIYFDSVIESGINVRQWVADNARQMLCNFTIINGKFGLEPGLPVDAAGSLSTDPVPVDAIFTEGNIIEDSFALDYLDYEQRIDFIAVASYRYGEIFQLPQETTVTVQYADKPEGEGAIEAFDLASFCTQKTQAILTMKYMLAIRRHVTHTIKFQTTPDGLALKPGSFIRVVTQANPYTPAKIGAVMSDNGRVVSISALKDGRHPIAYYSPGMESVVDGEITITNGVVEDTSFWGSVFTIRDAPTTAANVYQIQQITADEQGLIEVVAVDFPCDDQLRSLVVQDMLDDAVWMLTE